MGLLLLQGASDLNPRELFANNEQGLWLDPSQMSTLYQDSNGVTPCTAAGDPVGLILDQSRGGLSQIGADLVTNGTFAADSDWTKGANWTIGSGVATKTGGAANNLTQTIGSTAAAWYRVSLDVTRSAGTLTVSLGTSGTTYAITATGSYTFFILAGSGTQTLTLEGDSSFAGTVDNVVVRNVPGNHAYQSTSSARPTLARIPVSGRRNLLTRTEEFDNNSVWAKDTSSATANATTAPDGTLTADRLVPDNTSNVHRFRGSLTTSSVAHVVSFYAKAGEISKIAYREGATTGAFASFDLSNGTVINQGTGGTGSITSAGNGWYRCSISFTAGATTRIDIIALPNTFSAGDSPITNYTFNGTDGVFVWGAQLETGSTATNYQKVTSTHDVTESGFADLWYLSFDGSDDSLITNSVDFSGTDEMTVIAGVRKLSDAVGIVVEHSATSDSNNGSFTFLTTATGYGVRLRGSSLVTTTQDTYNAPRSDILSCVYDTEKLTTATQINSRVNSVFVQSGSGTTTNVNFGNYAIYIGRRGGASFPFNGHLYQLIIRGKTTPTGKLLEAERFAGKKTGVSF